VGCARFTGAPAARARGFRNAESYVAHEGRTSPRTGRGIRAVSTATSAASASRDTDYAREELVAHCHAGLGTLYRRTGNPAQAREHLTTATTMYREMDMRFWLE